MSDPQKMAPVTGAAQARDSGLRQDEAFLRRLHRALLPCGLSILSENINILVDGILVGQRVGTDGLSAISLCVPVYLILCVVGPFWFPAPPFKPPRR